MGKRIELLAPSGDVNSVKAAIAAGANAVYCGLNKYNARNRAENIDFDNLNGLLHLAHQHNCKVFLTLNINFVESEFPDLLRWLNRLVNTSIDGIIIQDFGLFYLINHHFESLKIHVSTQLTTHNKGQLKFLRQLEATRVNLSRELNFYEIESLTKEAHENNLLTEVFVHGSYCISYSGICYMSSVQSGNSGNRGRCSQPCRDQYETTVLGRRFPLNLKDNSAYFDVGELYEAGVDSVKIEGRIKQYHYVYTVVDAYKKQLQNVYAQKELSRDNSQLYKVFNRDFSNAYLKNEIGEDMFIDHVRDNSLDYHVLQNDQTNSESIDRVEQELYKEKEEMKVRIKADIDRLNSESVPLIIRVSGEKDVPLKVEVITSFFSFTFLSKKKLASSGNMSLNSEELMKRFKALNETEYFINDLILDDLHGELFIPFSELSVIKNKILYRLRDSRETIAPVMLPKLDAEKRCVTPLLAVLINNKEDIYCSEKSESDFFFELPNEIHHKLDEWISFFLQNKNLVPWFPSVLIGENYNAVVEFLYQLKPAKIVTNNTGVAYAAHEMAIPWIAGPNLNSMNSYALRCLKEQFNCAGAFVSNELSKQQIQSIKPPTNFNLYFSIYHPITLMSSRQCFFKTITGCVKTKVDDQCLSGCRNSATLKNLKNEMLYVDKTIGNFNVIYNEINYLNTEIIGDMPGKFFGLLVDLRNIKTNTKLLESKLQIINRFEEVIKGGKDVDQLLHANIFPTTIRQYKKGI